MLIYEGIVFSLKTIVPSVFPFLVLSDLLIGTGAPMKLSKALSPLFCKLRINPYILPPLCLGIICGFPIGAIYTRDLNKKGKITKKEADVLLPMCSYASPAFVISAVGTNMLHSKKAGMIMWVCSIAVCISVGLIMMPRSISNRTDLPEYNSNDKYVFSVSLLESMQNGTKTIISVGAVITFFYMLCGMCRCIMSELGAGMLYQAILCAVLEIGSGCRVGSQLSQMGVVISAFSIGFCGLCVFFQVKNAAHESADMRIYLLIKSVCGIMSALFLYIIL